MTSIWFSHHLRLLHNCLVWNTQTTDPKFVPCDCETQHQKLLGSSLRNSPTRIRDSEFGNNLPKVWVSSPKTRYPKLGVVSFETHYPKFGIVSFPNSLQCGVMSFETPRRRGGLEFRPRAKLLDSGCPNCETLAQTDTHVRIVPKRTSKFR